MTQATSLRPFKVIAGLMGVLILAAVVASALHIDVSGVRTPTPVAPVVRWWPSDFALTSDPNVAFRFMEKSEFQCELLDSCWGMWIQSKDGCPAGLYVEVSIMDSNGAAIGYSNDTVGSVAAGQKARLLFENTEDYGQAARLSKVSCR